jgi:hypothetical protein
LEVALELLAGDKVFTTGINALEIIHIVLPAAIEESNRIQVR